LSNLKNLEYDGATQYEGGRVRINIFVSLNGPAMVLRLIPLKILSMAEFTASVSGAVSLP